MPRLPQASELLKQKGYVEPKFDTVGFTELVYEWFRQHDLKDKLIIRPRRFVEMDNPPSCGYIDMTDTEKWIDAIPWEKYLVMSQKGEIRPFIFVDTPCIVNAMYSLQLMSGFIVTKCRKKAYEVTLV
jgi:hypothetical protein